MRADGDRGGVARWRCLFDAPLVLAAWLAMACGVVMVLDVAGALRRAEVVRRDAVPELARLAAETALVRLLADEPAANRASLRVGDAHVTIRRGPATDFALTCAIPGEGEFHFRCDEVPGAAPRVFEFAGSAVDPVAPRVAAGARLIGQDDLPRLDRDRVAAAVRGDRLGAFRLDQGVALLALPSGTEKADYVFEPKRIADLDAAGGLVVVPGHLWVEAGDRPLRLLLTGDLVVVVEGNVYVGRPLTIEGPGRLLLVATCGTGEASFADLDGNARWSAGDVVRGATAFVGPSEGAGNLYLGLPGSRGAVHCDCGFVVEGELHATDTVQVAGPVVLAHGATPRGPMGGRVVLRGAWRFDVERETVPGFLVSGGPRPGRLERVTAADTDREQTLYLSGLAR